MLSTSKVIWVYNNTIIVSNFVLNLVLFQDKDQLFFNFIKFLKQVKNLFFLILLMIISNIRNH